MFIKIGETTEILGIEKAASCMPAVSDEVLENFRKFANNLKKVAPKAEDFLYFSAVMMHAAESSSLNDDGTIKLNGSGNPVEVGWNKSGGSWRWETNDSSIKPYKNSNGDIFPEEELVKAYKKWVHKPLCIDHKSSSVDHVRGFIVDTYYDRKLKRVIALCALDKQNYPDLARKVSTGYSNCVSMGTAVGRAICSDCGTVAKAEADFCKCMRSKSCYGEINVDLNPIELSIVVNGADPKANIKHIIAAANTLNSYIETKEKEFTKLADKFTANINFNIGGDMPSGTAEDKSVVTEISVASKDLDSFAKDVNKAIEDFKKLQDSLVEAEKSSEHGNDSASNGLEEMKADTTVDSGLAPPHARYASSNVDPITQLREFTKDIEVKLSHMKHNLDKLANASNIQEENMSGNNEISKKGYFQGTEEPTPGQAKYPKDKLNEDLRNHTDKQMVGQMDTGPVDGMHPGPDSTNMSELERKKMLARAESEERAMKRNAIVNLAKQAIENKQAYYLNGDGKENPGTPTPGKVKYPADKLNEALRNHEDKHMNGQKPFPGVGSVDGMHPSPSSADIADEKKRKEMLSRASLVARFVKASNNDGTQNLGKSAWEVFLGDKLVLKASVNELSGNRAGMMYDGIATKSFGSKLIEKIKVHGAPAVLSLVKRAEDPAAPAAPPAAEAPPAEAPPMEDMGGSGDKKESVSEIAEKIRDLSSDLVEADAAVTGEKAEMGKIDGAPEMAAAASGTANLHVLRREINGALGSALKESIAELANHQQELELIQGMYDKGAVNSENSEFVGSLVDDALTEAKSAIADGFKLMTAFVKYARGTKTIIKQAEIQAELDALEGDDNMSDDNSSDDLMQLIQETNADLADAETNFSNDDPEELTLLDAELGEEPADDKGNQLEEMFQQADDNDATLQVKPGEALPSGYTGDVEVKASFNSREGRAALRAKLAADATGKYDDGQLQDMSKQKFSDMLDEADSLADGQTKLDVKPSDNLGKVETLPEINKEMLDLAKAPPKVRKEAEAIHKLVLEGSLDKNDIDSLVSLGLDKDAVAYYKKYWAQADGGSEFASELVKEHVKAGMEEELNKYRIKLARSYELAYDMVDRGMCAHDRSAISDEVERIMKFNDDNFESLKRVVAKRAPSMHKEAGRMPQVGMIGSGEVNTSASPSDENLYSQLSAAFSKSPKKLF